jgi:hypothetical protein
VQQGQYYGRITFPECYAPLRSNESFRHQSQPEHHKEISPLCELAIDMINCFPLDYMHSICEGVLLKLLRAYPSAPLPYRVPKATMDTINDELRRLIPFIPCDFARRPRSLEFLGLWKATELRLFLLYLGPFIIPNSNLSPLLIEHFLCLFVFSFILAHPILHNSWNTYAKSLSVTFIQLSQSIFGDEFLVYNVHSLVHLPDDVKLHGEFDRFSAFKFENFLHFIRRLVKSPFMPFAQIVKRVCESNPCLGLFSITPKGKTPVFKHIHQDGFLPNDFSSTEYIQYKSITFSNFSLKLDCANCYFLYSNNVYQLCNVLCSTDGHNYLVARCFLDRFDAFSLPLPSSRLSIFTVNKQHTSVAIIPLHEPLPSISKVMALPHKNGQHLYVTPILHTCLE